MIAQQEMQGRVVGLGVAGFFGGPNLVGVILDVRIQLLVVDHDRAPLVGRQHPQGRLRGARRFVPLAGGEQGLAHQQHDGPVGRVVNQGVSPTADGSRVLALLEFEFAFAGVVERILQLVGRRSVRILHRDGRGTPPPPRFP